MAMAGRTHMKKSILHSKKIFNSFIIVFLVLADSWMLEAHAEDLSRQKVILDTDFYHFNDDHETLMMLAQLHHNDKLNLLGVTILTGNQWIEKAEVDVLRAVERLGLASQVPVLLGADNPLVHDVNQHKAEKLLYGSGYAGAWENFRPTSRDEIQAPPDGFARKTQASKKHAVNFIIEQVRNNPGEITILAIGPLTNIALAIRMAPDIQSKIKEVVIMGGAIKVPGNVTPAAEFNWWFDPEAARIVMRSSLNKVLIPLDATNDMVFTRDIYEKVTKYNGGQDDPSEIYFKPRYQKDFYRDSNYFFYVWDSLVVAYLISPNLIAESRPVYVDVNDTLGPDYGRALGYGDKDWGTLTYPPGLKVTKVIYKMDKEGFWNLYESLLGKPNSYSQL